MRFRATNTDGSGILSSRGEGVGETCTRHDAKESSETVEDSDIRVVGGRFPAPADPSSFF